MGAKIEIKVPVLVFCMRHVCHSFCQFYTELDTLGKRKVQLEYFLHHTGLWACLVGHFLDCRLMKEGSAHCEQYIPGLSYIRKLADGVERWLSA